MNDFIKERNDALRSLDKNKILDYCNKHGMKMPEDEELFWAGVHKAIVNIYFRSNDITMEEFDRSMEWLNKHGFSPDIV